MAGDPASVAQALAIADGELLEGIGEEWAVVERARVDEVLRTAGLRAARQLQPCGNLEAAREICGRLQDRDRYDEEVHRLALEIRAGMGDRVGLVRRHREYTDLLRAELEADPSDETEQLYQDLLAQSSPNTRADPQPGDRAGGARLAPEGGMDGVGEGAPSWRRRAADAERAATEAEGELDLTGRRRNCVRSASRSSC